MSLPSIECGDQLPVCLVGDRLVFLIDCIVTMNWAGVTVYREEKEGNSWDGATIPWFAWSVIGHPLSKEFRWASFWHDRWCESSQYTEDRTVGDAIFLRLLRESNVKKWKRLAMWLAVRLHSIFLWKGKGNGRAD